MNERIKFLIVGAAAGLLLGALGVRLTGPGGPFDKRPTNHEDRMLKRMKSELKLTPDQTNTVRDILGKGRDRMDALLTEVQPKFDALRTQTSGEIRAVLTPEQQVRFDEMHKRFEERRKKGELRLPPFPPPHDRS